MKKNLTFIRREFYIDASLAEKIRDEIDFITRNDFTYILIVDNNSNNFVYKTTSNKFFQIDNINNTNGLSSIRNVIKNHVKTDYFTIINNIFNYDERILSTISKEISKEISTFKIVRNNIVEYEIESLNIFCKDEIDLGSEFLGLISNDLFDFFVNKSINVSEKRTILTEVDFVKNGFNDHYLINPKLTPLTEFLKAITVLKNEGEFFDFDYILKIKKDIIALNKKGTLNVNKLENFRKIYSATYKDSFGDLRNCNKNLPSISMISDSNQWKQLVTNIYMIIKQSNNSEKIIINAILFKLSNKREEIEQKFKELGIKDNVRLFFIDETNLRIDGSKLEHVTMATNIRLYLPEILDDKSTYYIDNDIVHIGDIVNLLEYFDENINYARAWSPSVEWASKLASFSIDHSNLHSYYNAGAIHLNLEKMRNDNFIEKAENYFFENSKNILFADQDIINAILPLEDGPTEMNISRTAWPERNLGMVKDYKAYHFISKNKQWDEFDYAEYQPGSGDLSLTEILLMSEARFKWKEFNSIVWNEDTNVIYNDKLLILVTLHKTNEDDFNYWLNIYDELNGEIELSFATDYDLNEKYKNEIIGRGIKLSTSSTNSKISSIKEFIKKYEDDLPKFIKIFDPDDKVNTDLLRTFANVIKFNNIEKNIITSFICNRNGERREEFWDSVAAYNTVLLKEDLIKNINLIPEISKSSDLLLGFIANIETGFCRIDVPFYEYLIHNGISNYDISLRNHKKYIEELNKLINFFEENEEHNKDYTFNSSLSQSEIWFISNIFSRTLNYKDYVCEIEKYFDKFIRVSRGNENRRSKQNWDNIFLQQLKENYFNSDKNITLILTVFELTKEQEEYWIKNFKELRKRGFEFWILVDNPLSKSIELFEEFSEHCIFNEMNSGKYNTVVNFLNLNKIKTSHFKIVDPDDYIVLDNLIEIDKEIKNDSSIYLMDSHKVRESGVKDLIISDLEIEPILIKRRKSFGTSWTILPTKFFNNAIDINGDNLIGNWLEDQFLSLTPLSQGASVERINGTFYLYNISGGMTSQELDTKELNTLSKTLIYFAECVRTMLKGSGHPILDDTSYIEGIFTKSGGKEIFKETISIVNKISIYNKIRFITFFDFNMIRVFITHYLSLRNHYASSEFEYYIATDTMTIRNYKHFFEENGIKYVDVTKIMDDKFGFAFSISDHITYFTMGRLILHEVFEWFEDFKGKISYIDVDTTFNGRINDCYFSDENNIAFTNTNTSDIEMLKKIKEFWARTLNNNEEAARHTISSIMSGDYFNAGFIIMNNIKKYIQLTKRCFAMIGELDDQTLLNYYNNGEIKVIPDFTHNNQVKNEVVENAVIYHFSGKVKPWLPRKDDDPLILENFGKTNFYEIHNSKEATSVTSIERQNINLLLTLYKPSKDEVDYWKSVYHMIKNDKYINIYFLVDGVDLGDMLIDIPDQNIFKSDENIGKFKLIYNFVKERNDVKGYLKICDPDDYISVWSIRRNPIYEENKIILFKMTKFDEKPKILDDEYITKQIKEKKGSLFSSFGNSWTLIPVNPIRDDVYYSGNRIDFHDDQLLGYVAYQNGADILEKRNLPLYYYVFGIGQTRVDNSMNLFRKVLPTFVEIKSLFKKGGRDNPVNWPSEYSYYYEKRDKFIEEGNPTNEEIKEIDDIINKIISIDAFKK